MQSAVPVGKGSMIAVLGMDIDIEEINKLLNNENNHEGICEIANDNAIGQVILSGEKNKILSIKDKLKENKLNAYLLK